MSVKSAALALLLPLAACTGELVGFRPPGTPADPEHPVDPARPPAFDCQPAAQQPSAEVVLRLTPAQYRNVLEDLLARGTTGAERDALLTSLAPSFEALPVDGSAFRAIVHYDSMDQRISPLLVEPQLDIATGVGAWLTADDARLTRFVQAFAPGCGAPASCVDDFLAGFGPKVLRRPLDAEDLAFYRAAWDDPDYGGYAAGIGTLLMSPDFLFRAEFRGDGVDGRSDLTKLTPAELANRVSFALLNSMPDDALFDAAAHDFAGPGHTLDEQVRRLLGSARAQGQFENFFRQWLRLDRVPGFNPSSREALALVSPGSPLQPLPLDTDLEQLRQDAFQEMVDLMTWAAANGSFRDALLTDVSFARSPLLARIYGVPAWDGDLANPVRFPEGQRAGLFTRAGYLFSGFADSNPIIRGARLRTEYLCDLIEPPADTNTPAGYVAPEVPTVRNLVVAKTQMAGTNCQSCHQPLINPLGFPFEDFDSFGRARQSEPLRASDGSVASWTPVDAHALPDLGRSGDLTEVTGGVAMSRLLADSRKLQGCFARHSFRYLTGRTETLGATNEDACALDGMERAVGTGRLDDLLVSFTKTDAFTLRRMPEGN